MKSNVVKLIVIGVTHLTFASMALADTPQCEELLAEIREDGKSLAQATTTAEQIEITKRSFNTMMKAIFSCKDTQNLDNLENLMNQTGTVLKQNGVPGIWQSL